MSQRKFEELLYVLGEQSYYGNEEVDIFEDKLESLGYERPYFGIARADWDGIEVERNKYVLKRMGCRFYASYYDGMQAPFEVFTWNDSMETLENLLKETSPILYEMYEKRLRTVEELYGFKFERN